MRAVADDLHQMRESQEQEKFATASGVVEAVDEDIAEVGAAQPELHAHDTQETCHIL